MSGVLNPDELFSAEHWMDSLGAAAIVTGGIKMADKVAPGIVSVKDDITRVYDDLFKKKTMGTIKGADDVPTGVFGKNTVGAAKKYVPNNIKMANNKYLKKKGIDVHALKTELVGKKNISHYDLYVDKDSGMLWLYRKGGKGEPMPTYEFIK